jgi:DNA-binding transcriptional ArsR family regulator
MSDVRDYELLADEIDGKTAERHRALGDPLRLLILDLVLERAMTVTDLADRVGRPKGTVAHHVDVLVDAGLLRVVRTRKVRAMEERFYGRVARTINVPDSDDELPFLRQAMEQADLERLRNDELGSAFTMRHARIPAVAAQEFADRLMALALEFADAPRDGDVEYALLAAVFPTTRPVAPKSPAKKEARHVRG